MNVLNSSKALIFDIDNTLYDYDFADKCAYKKVYKYIKKHYKISYEDWNNFLNQAKRSVKSKLSNTASSHNRMLYFKKALEYIDDNFISESLKLYNIYEKEFFKRMKRFGYVMPILKYCKANRIKVGVCTDMMCEVQLKKLKVLKIDKYIDCVWTSEENGSEKPDTSMYENISNDLDMIPYDQCTFIGDDPEKDIIGPRRIGMRTLDAWELRRYECCNW